MSESIKDQIYRDEKRALLKKLNFIQLIIYKYSKKMQKKIEDQANENTQTKINNMIQQKMRHEQYKKSQIDKATRQVMFENVIDRAIRNTK